jgi:hypothetical protein
MEFLKSIFNSDFFKNYVLSVLLIALILFLLVFTVRIFFRLTILFLLRKYKHYRKKKKLKFEKKDIVSTPKEDEELLRDKEEETKLIGVERMPAEYDYQQEIGGQQVGELEEGKIVGVAEPIGFWTSLVLGQKLSFLVNQAHILSQREKKGFWVSLIEAQSRSMERQRGRGGR